MDMLSALMSPVSKEDELKALADSLRKRKQAADFYSLSTIKPLQAMGQRAGEEVMETGQRQGVLREALARRQADQAQQAERLAAQQAENALDRGALLERALQTRTTGSSRPTNIGRYIDEEGNSAMIGYVQGIPTYLSTQEPVPPEMFDRLEPQTALTESAMASNLSKFSEKADKIIPLVQNINALDDLLEPFEEEGYSVDDVPGMSYIEKAPGFIGASVRAIKDYGEEGAPSGTIFSAVQAIQNAIGVERAGLAQTVSEIARIQKELGKDVMSNPQVFMEYYPRLKKVIKSDLDNMRAGTPKKVVNEYRKSLGDTGFDITNVQFKDIQLNGMEDGGADDEDLQEGDIVENPETGERMIVRDGQLEPL